MKNKKIYITLEIIGLIIFIFSLTFKANLTENFHKQEK